MTTDNRDPLKEQPEEQEVLDQEPEEEFETYIDKYEQDNVVEDIEW